MIAQGKAGLIRQGKAGRLSVEIYENRAALGKAAASDAAAAIERVIAEKGSIFQKCMLIIWTSMWVLARMHRRDSETS